MCAWMGKATSGGSAVCVQSERALPGTRARARLMPGGDVAAVLAGARRRLLDAAEQAAGRDAWRGALSGSLDFEAFRATCQRALKFVGPEEDLRVVFDSLDPQGTGSVDATEVVVLRVLGPHHSLERASAAPCNPCCAHHLVAGSPEIAANIRCGKVDVSVVPWRLQSETAFWFCPSTEEFRCCDVGQGESRCSIVRA